MATKMTAEQAKQAAGKIMADARFSPAIKADVYRGLGQRQADGGFVYTSNADCGRPATWYDRMIEDAVR